MITNKTLDEIECLIKPDEGYHLYKTIGNNISYLDCVYYYGQERETIKRIEELPEIEPFSRACFKVLPIAAIVSVDMIEDDCEDILNKETPSVSFVEEYSKGAGGVAFYLYSIGIPLLLFLLSPFYNKAIEHIFNRIIIKRRQWLKDRTFVMVKQKKLLKNVSKWINYDVNNIQIVSCNKFDNDDKYEVVIRTFTSKQYRVTCSLKSKILELNEVDVFQ